MFEELLEELYHLMPVLKPPVTDNLPPQMLVYGGCHAPMPSYSGKVVDQISESLLKLRHEEQ